VQAGQGEDPENGAVGGDDQPQRASFGQRAPVRPQQDAEPGRIAEPGAGHVDHDGGVPLTGGLQQDRAQLLGVGDVDLGGCCQHGQAVDHQGISDA
jgi:hypothetical protein